MKSACTARLTKQRGLTFIELLVSTALVGVVGMVGFGVMRSGMVLSQQNSGINLSGLRSRQVIDRLGDQVRYSLAKPELITATGATTTAATADGIRVKRYLGGPYVLKDSNGGTTDITVSHKIFVVEYRADLPTPAVGDWLAVESATQPELEISAVATMTNSGALKRSKLTMVNAIGEAVRPSTTRIAGLLYRREAYLFVASEGGTNPRFALRRYPSVRSTTNFSLAANYEVMSLGYRRLNNAAFFSNITSSGVPALQLKTVAHATGQESYTEKRFKKTTTTTLPIQMRLWTLPH